MLSNDFKVLHAIGERFEASQVRSATAEIAAIADGHLTREQIVRGVTITRTDADIRYVSSEIFFQAQSRVNQEPHIGREVIGVIAIDKKEFSVFENGPGRILGRFFEFIPLKSRDELLNAKNKGCRQCLCRITAPRHQDYQAIFGAENIHQAIREAGLEPVIIKNGYSSLRLKLSAE